MIPMTVATEEQSRRWADTSTRWHLKARLLTLVSFWRQKKKEDTTLVGFCAGKCHIQSY